MCSWRVDHIFNHRAILEPKYESFIQHHSHPVDGRCSHLYPRTSIDPLARAAHVALASRTGYGIIALASNEERFGMNIEDILLHHLYEGNEPGHYRSVIEVFKQNEIVRVRYSDSKGKNSAIPITKFAEWARRLIAPPRKRPRFPNKHKKIVVFPGD